MSSSSTADSPSTHLNIPSSPKNLSSPAESSRMTLEKSSRPPLLQIVIIAMFITIILFIMPFIFETHLRIGFTLASICTFLLVPYPVQWFSDKYWSGLDEKKRLECENRLASIAFNLTTGIPAYLGWWELFPGQPTMGEIMAGKTWMEDCFAGWSIGYIMYDFPTLFKTYGNGASIIALHHVAEAVIVYTYTVNRIGSLYLMGGGLMQLSSGLLHVQRMMHITGYSSNAFTRLINWLLIFFLVPCQAPDISIYHVHLFSGQSLGILAHF